MILPDSSAWVEYDGHTQSPVDVRLHELIETDGDLATTQPVMMEVIAGARDDDRERDLRRLLLRFELLPFHAGVDFEAAARTYRLCRAAGITPRGLVDCMIAAVAMRHGAAVLSHDVDFARLADVVSLELDDASLR